MHADTVRADDYRIVDVARAREHLAARGEALKEADKIIRSVKAWLAASRSSKARASRSEQSLR
ncbi:hypothetical protein ACVJMZ_000050 [Sinorhizobium medicae]